MYKLVETKDWLLFHHPLEKYLINSIELNKEGTRGGVNRRISTKFTISMLRGKGNAILSSRVDRRKGR